jgi:hypothetical protein
MDFFDQATDTFGCTLASRKSARLHAEELVAAVVGHEEHAALHGRVVGELDSRKLEATPLLARQVEDPHRIDVGDPESSDLDPDALGLVHRHVEGALLQHLAVERDLADVPLAVLFRGLQLRAAEVAHVEHLPAASHPTDSGNTKPETLVSETTRSGPSPDSRAAQPAASNATIEKKTPAAVLGCMGMAPSGWRVCWLC